MLHAYIALCLQNLIDKQFKSIELHKKIQRNLPNVFPIEMIFRNFDFRSNIHDSPIIAEFRR